jgi:hypothetical protein
VGMVWRVQYERLARHLEADGRPRIVMTIAEAERIVGEKLPNSARDHPAWWGSDPNHTQAVWLDAGYIASPDLRGGTVTFTKSLPQVRVATTVSELKLERQRARRHHRGSAPV